MDVIIKVIVAMVVMVMLSFVVTFLLVQPLLAIVLIGVISTMLVLAFDPSTGKAMAQLVIPVTLVFFFLELLTIPFLSFDWWELIIVAGILYLMFLLFTGGSGHDPGALLYSKVSLKLSPLYGAILILAILTDPSGRLSLLIMVGSVIGLMALYATFLRSYDEWPVYQVLAPQQVVVISRLHPRGKVKLGQEVWWAESLEGSIEVGETVEVQAIDGLTMKVVRAQTQIPDKVSDHDVPPKSSHSK